MQLRSGVAVLGAGDGEQAAIEFGLLDEAWPTACRDVATLSASSPTPPYA